MATYPKSIDIGGGLDDDGIFDTLIGQGRGRKADVSSPLFSVAREYMHAIKDERAEVHSVTVNSVTVDLDYPKTVSVDFTVEWTIYRGCEDRNEHDFEDMYEQACYDDGKLTFQIPAPRRPLNPC